MYDAAHSLPQSSSPELQRQLRKKILHVYPHACSQAFSRVVATPPSGVYSKTQVLRNTSLCASMFAHPT